ncbi:MAG: N-acetyltransferase [Gammaproteobacteria bacterium]|nr:MAG: N-acetyltransferase [Gammaproteobacteria bacterium]
MRMQWQASILDDIGAVVADAWNALGVAAYPHLRHEFLHALEAHGCLGERFGWLPRHIVIHDTEGRLVAACPLYLKSNSYGEFVFDWSWADAYARNGLEYYPKLVSASPYTPATGPKLLLAPDAPIELRELLLDRVMALALENDCSSIHWLFTTDEETAHLENHRYLRRMGCQFHWENRGWNDFDAFLGSLTHGKRKNIRRERRRTREAGITFRWLDGHTASAEDWADFHLLYQSTFDRKGGIPTLSLDFFEALAHQLPDQVLLVQARHQGRPVAAAFNLVGEQTLYGRHWGCRERFHSLHFETCYYQGLEFCLQRGLRRFEPGAQGEHKVSRGFLPTPTWSAHWLGDARFSRAVQQFLQHEREGMQDYLTEMRSHSPYRQTMEK